MPRISVVVPVYNVERYLARCLESLRSQTLADIEIVCVNDGATDRSPALLRLAADVDPRIVVVDKPNGGLSSARNAGETSPVSSVVWDLGMPAMWKHASTCCETSGFVGATKMIFAVLVQRKKFNMMVAAIKVLPRPVGSATRRLW